jgi:predicted DNA-binding protein
MNTEYNRMIDIIAATEGKYKFEIIEEAIKQYLENLGKLKK